MSKIDTAELSRMIRDAEKRGRNEVVTKVEKACGKAEALTQDAIGHVSEHWRGRDYADGLDAGIETTAELVRAALTEGGAQ